MTILDSVCLAIEHFNPSLREKQEKHFFCLYFIMGVVLGQVK